MLLIFLITYEGLKVVESGIIFDLFPSFNLLNYLWGIERDKTLDRRWTRKLLLIFLITYEGLKVKVYWSVWVFSFNLLNYLWGIERTVLAVNASTLSSLALLIFLITYEGLKAHNTKPALRALYAFNPINYLWGIESW